jgi:haloalkane dehalogenase
MIINGLHVHYVDEGSGDPIVFLHGLPAWSFIFRHLIRGLAGQYRCIAPDMIGFGLSEKPEGWSYTPASQVANLAQFLDQLGIKQANLAMHDFGAAIGTALAVEQPERFERITVINGACWDLQEDPGAEKIAKLATGALGQMMLTTLNPWPKMVQRTFGDKVKYTEAFEKAIAGPTLSKDGRIALWKTAKALAASGSFFNDVWRHRKNLAETSTQFIWGMKDPIFGEHALNKWWHDFPLSSVERLNTCGHYPTEECAHQVLEALQTFLTAPKNASYMA